MEWNPFQRVIKTEKGTILKLLVYVKNINCNIPTTSRWARGDDNDQNDGGWSWWLLMVMMITTIIIVSIEIFLTFALDGHVGFLVCKSYFGPPCLLSLLFPHTLHIQFPFLNLYSDLFTSRFRVSVGSPSRGGNVAVYVLDINQPSLPTPFYSVLFCVCFCLYDPFNCISFHKWLSRHLSAFSLCFPGLFSALLVLSNIYVLMKVSVSPEISLCAWLGLKH